jgi:hypothetical protein
VAENSSVKKITTTAKIPKRVQQSMLERIIKDEYGLKGKSRWISESIEKFLEMPNFPELVDIAEEMEEMTEVVSISLTELLMKKLDYAVVQVRKEYPAMEGVRSKVIRAGIIQRLLKSQLR